MVYEQLYHALQLWTIVSVRVSVGGVFIYYFLFHFRFLYFGGVFFFNQTTIPLTLVGNEITVVNSTLQAPCWLPAIPHSSRKNYKKPQNVTIASYVEFDTKLLIKNVCECKGLKKAEKQQKARNSLELLRTDKISSRIFKWKQVFGMSFGNQNCFARIPDGSRRLKK